MTPRHWYSRHANCELYRREYRYPRSRSTWLWWLAPVILLT
jgi:hypothetical protein